MSAGDARRARVKAFAKLNLDLRVLHRREDGFHEIRTVFQTVSLADSLSLAVTPSRRTSISLSGPEIPDNLVARASRAVLDELKATALVEIALDKRIPMGAGLGGGSSDAAAVLLALPALLGRPVPSHRLLALARTLGSDVPFFLLGGSAVGLGRGTELYPLPDQPARQGLIVAPGLHVSTPDAYRALARPMSGCGAEAELNTIERFQSGVWDPCARSAGNDFESVVFKQFPSLGKLKRRLEKLGAETARMSGSGSSLFGFFRSQAQIDRAVRSFRTESVFPITLVSRVRYQNLWRRWLKGLVDEATWPPRSRHAR